MPSGQERLVLAACDELAGHGDGFVLASDIDGKTGMGIRAVQDCLRGLDRGGLIDLVPLENGDLRAAVTPYGRQELAKYVEGPRSFAPGHGGQTQNKVVPKGLRSFDAEDKDFFLSLLPGPRRGDGLPESVHFWKVRIEEMDPDSTFRVGYIFGPSGCGKSSLVKAGLLPRLAKSIIPLYIEATGAETEARLLRGLRKYDPNVSSDLDLRSSMVAVRERIRPGSSKILIVIDQFEQWYHATGAEPGSALAQALSECDGGRVQAIILVRDDYSMALHRFMAVIGVRQNQDQNFAVVDLFDLQHARKVLNAFGRGYGILADDPGEISGAQNEFLDRALKGLSQEGRVISVRLALFAEMLKGKAWTPETLKQVGGAEGVGVTFLEETFSAGSAPPSHRIHQKAAQSVLRALLPESGSNIKGKMRSYDELLAVSGYGARRDEFDELIRILNNELRLISPTEPEGAEGTGQARTQAGERFFLLTHDYLVPSIRDWLTRKQRETRQGRSELRLAERSSLWNARPENRHLPSLPEWTSIELLTMKKDWTGPQWRMMKRARRVHGMRTLGVVTMLALLVWGGIEFNGTLRGSDLVESLKTTKITGVPPIVQKLDRYRRWADPALRKLVRSDDDTSPEKLHASLALLPVDRSQLPFLAKRLLVSRPLEILVLRDALKPHRSILIPKLWSVLDSARPADESLLPAASALAIYDPTSSSWDSVGAKVTEAMVTANPIDIGDWHDALFPVRRRLNTPLAAIFRDKHRPETEHSLATNILTSYASDDANLIASLLMDSDPRAFAAFFPIARAQADRVIPLFEAEIDRKVTVAEGDRAMESLKDGLAERQARAAVALLRMGKSGEILHLLRHSADPRVRSFIVNWLSPLGADATIVAGQFQVIPIAARPDAGQGKRFMDAVLFHLETSQRRALILALGTYGNQGFSTSERERLTRMMFDLYRTDPDAGIHGAVAWTLRQWGQQEMLKAADAELMNSGDVPGRRWFVNRQGPTLAVIEGPVEFRMGSAPGEPLTDASGDTPHMISIPRRFAIADREVTIEQYRRFVKVNPGSGPSQRDLDRYSPDADGPMVVDSWFKAVAYCNWLSEQEKLPKDQWCYIPNQAGAYDAGMTIPADILERKGYRLPTEAEWEYACRAGTITSRYYGVSDDLLARYAVYHDNSRDHAWGAGGRLPNDLGLFDMLGNEFEWVMDRYETERQAVDTIEIPEVVDTKHTRIIRGGSFDYDLAYIRSAYRTGNQPLHRNYADTGFRPARTCP